MPPRASRSKSGLFGADYQHRAKDVLSSRFLAPPFSVLNTREGWWQERKRQWLSIGIRSELGRGANLLERSLPGRVALLLSGHYREVGPFIEKLRAEGKNDAEIIEEAQRKSGKSEQRIQEKRQDNLKPNAHLSEKQQRAMGCYRAPAGTVARGPASKRNQAIPGGGTGPNSAYLFKGEEGYGQGPDAQEGGTGTSVFDPVLCELVYRWFAPPKAHVLDPFAGGSVRGIVAGELGHHYVGIDLSERQIKANGEQAESIGTDPRPLWIPGDSLDIDKLAPKEKRGYNLLFSCPPYGFLERYSDDPRDLSTLSTPDFTDKITEIVGKSCALLAPEAFACFVVGDYRDEEGFYQNFPALTCLAFADAGMQLYNHAILLTATGSLPLRINAQFTGSRKLGTTHQHVLIFAKGQPKKFVKQWPPLSGDSPT